MAFVGTGITDGDRNVGNPLPYRCCVMVGLVRVIGHGIFQCQGKLPAGIHWIGIADLGLPDGSGTGRTFLVDSGRKMYSRFVLK